MTPCGKHMESYPQPESITKCSKFRLLEPAFYSEDYTEFLKIRSCQKKVTYLELMKEYLDLRISSFKFFSLYMSMGIFIDWLIYIRSHCWMQALNSQSSYLSLWSVGIIGIYHSYHACLWVCVSVCVCVCIHTHACIHIMSIHLYQIWWCFFKL
jgi:hypothetical protein